MRHLEKEFHVLFTDEPHQEGFKRLHAFVEGLRGAQFPRSIGCHPLAYISVATGWTIRMVRNSARPIKT